VSSSPGPWCVRAGGAGSSDVLQGAVGSLRAGPVARGGHAAVPTPHVRGSRSRAGSLGGVVLLSPLLCACSLSLSKKQRRVARGAGQAAPAPARTDGNCAVEKLRGKEVRAPPTQCPRAALCCGEASLSTEEGSKLEWSSKYGQVSRGSPKTFFIIILL
jgi:hypothetical protein